MNKFFKILALQLPILRRLHTERNRYAELVSKLSHEIDLRDTARNTTRADTLMPEFRIFLVGYWGYRIVGDDAILSALLADLKDHLGDNIKITATSWRPEETSAHYNIQAIGFTDLSQILEQVRSSDIVIIAGGGAYNEYDPWRGEMALTNFQDYNVFCSTVPYLCKLNKTPCVICGVGVEPIYSDMAKRHVMRAFELATASTVRDTGSLEIIKFCGLTTNLPVVMACPASTIRPERTTYVDNIIQGAHRRKRRLIGVSIRHWNYEDLRAPDRTCDWEDWVAEDLREIQAKFDCEFLFIPFQASDDFGHLGNDLFIIRRVIDKAKIFNFSIVWDVPLEPESIAYGLSICDMVIACRFHSVILSFATGVPCVALSYSNKVRAVMVDANLSEFVVDLNSSEGGSLTSAVTKMLAKLPEFSEKVKVYREVLHKNALTNIEIIKDILMADKRRESTPLNDFILLYLAALSLRDKFNGDALNTIVALRDEIAKSLGSPHECKFVVQILAPLIEKIDDDAQIDYYYAFALHQSGVDLNLALSYYEMALAKGADEFWVRYNRGALLNSVGKTVLAENDWRVALTLPCLLKEPKEYIVQMMPHISHMLLK